MSITSIIPSMIFGVVLIIAWLPVIVLTENNNKGNKDEFIKLEDKIKTDLKLSDVTITFPTYSGSESIGNYTVTPAIVSQYNNNLYVVINKITKTIDDKGKTITSSVSSNKIINKPSIIDEENYKYLALQNKAYEKTASDINSNIIYELTFYFIPANKNIMKVEGLLQYKDELDMNIYDYEFGPKENAINAIKNRKSSANTLFKWLGRIGTFLMLFIGLSMLISPLTFLNQVGDSLPGPLKLLAIPSKIIANIYTTLSLFGSLLLTLLMTFFVWSIINYPLISIVIGGLIIGFILYFNKK